MGEPINPRGYGHDSAAALIAMIYLSAVLRGRMDLDGYRR